MRFNPQEVAAMQLEERIAQLQQYAHYYPNHQSAGQGQGAYAGGGYSGYRNKSSLGNTPPQLPFSWKQFLGAYGAIGVESGSISINERLRRDQEEFQKTLGHEVLHYVLGKMWDTNDGLISGNGWYLMQVLTNWIYCVQPASRRVYKN